MTTRRPKAERVHLASLARQIRDQRLRAKLHRKELMRAIKKLGAARRRLMRHTAAECRKIKAATRGAEVGVYAKRQHAQNAISCAENRLKALRQYGGKLSHLVERIALHDALLERTRTSRPRAREMRREKASLERHNIPPELLPLWDKFGHRQQFAPTAKTPRWERFLEWAHSDEGMAAVYVLAEQDADQYIKALQRELRSTEKQATEDPPF